jgi:hypothetical protein
MKSATVAALILAASFGEAHAQTKTEIFDLQTERGILAAKLYERDRPRASNAMLVSYRSRYSAKANQYFYELTVFWTGISYLP